MSSGFGTFEQKNQYRTALAVSAVVQCLGGGGGGLHTTVDILEIIPR